MIGEFLLFFWLYSRSTAFPLEARDGDIDPKIIQILDNANIPQYVAPAMNRDITDWLAIGDSFSAGISADIPSDELNYDCSRFKMSYPNQMNENPRFPGHSTSRTFVFGSCSGGKMQDVIDKQIERGFPDLKADYPKIGKPQVGTLSISGNDLGFSGIVNACIYHWVVYGVNIPTFSSLLQNKYVTGYVEFWNPTDTQCDSVSWAPSYKAAVPLTTTLRADMNSIVQKLNGVLKDAVTAIGLHLGGVYYVDGWQSKYDRHRFCEHEDDPKYHNSPIDPKTWFIHYNSPYQNSVSATGINGNSFFDQVDSILIPPKDGKSTADQISAVNGNLSQLNSAYNDVDSMTAALTALGKENQALSMLPITWIRIMHPKGSGYTAMSDAVIDSILTNGAKGANTKTCGFNNNNFMGRDDMNDKIGLFCADAAKQGVQDQNSGAITRTYNAGSRYEVNLIIDWAPGLDITQNMQANCVNYMTQIMDGCDSNDLNNPLNWKHGGNFQVGPVSYNIIPQKYQGYTPGICSFHLQEDESWSGVDGPGTEREWTFHVEKLTLKDGAKNVIATAGFAPNGKDGAPILAGDGNPFNFDSVLPVSLVITPEAQGNPKDYIQFGFGDESWTTNNKGGTPACTVGGFNTQYSPDNRNMDCSFKC